MKNRKKRMKMKRIWNLHVLSMVCGATLFGVLITQAQDTEPVTDDELTKYALVMDFADLEKEKLKTDYNGMIQAEELMTGGKRFKELKGAGGDEAKLAEIEATPEEIEAFSKIETANDENIAAFKEAYTSKIKDKEQLGAGLYNKITKALKTDEELKTRYVAILEGIKDERVSAEEELKEGEESSEGQ